MQFYVLAHIQYTLQSFKLFNFHLQITLHLFVLLLSSCMVCPAAQDRYACVLCIGTYIIPKKKQHNSAKLLYNLNYLRVRQIDNIQLADSHSDPYHIPSETQTKHTSAYSLRLNKLFIGVEGFELAPKQDSLMRNVQGNNYIFAK